MIQRTTKGQVSQQIRRVKEAARIVLPKLREDAHKRKRLEKEYPWKE